MIGQSREVAVIIAAYNSSQTIARAVTSALTQVETREVVVVDDASSDGTPEAAMAADDGSGRLTIIKQDANSGPAAARNRAIDASRSSHIAVLDADDYFLPGRFAPLFQIPHWDLIADNIAFLAGERADHRPIRLDRPDPQPTQISLTEFIEGNISRSGRPRAELGFVKPVIRREFIDRAGIRFDESLRLGEDYALYALMLAAGARFIRCKPCGYVAIEASNSLSGRHLTSDLEALLAFDRKFARNAELSLEERRAVGRHSRHVLSKVHHRQVLDRRRDGLVPALTAALARPSLLPQLAIAVLRDKLERPVARQEVRYLFN